MSLKHIYFSKYTNTAHSHKLKRYFRIGYIETNPFIAATANGRTKTCSVYCCYEYYSACAPFSSTFWKPLRMFVALGRGGGGEGEGESPSPQSRPRLRVVNMAYIWLQWVVLHSATSSPIYTKLEEVTPIVCFLCVQKHTYAKVEAVNIGKLCMDNWSFKEEWTVSWFRKVRKNPRQNSFEKQQIWHTPLFTYRFKDIVSWHVGFYCERARVSDKYSMTRRDAVGIGGRNCSSIPSNEYRTTHLLGPNRFAASVLGPFRLNHDPFPNSYPGGQRRRRRRGGGGTAQYRCCGKLMGPNFHRAGAHDELGTKKGDI